MSKRWDILSLGCAAVDDLLYVPSYPGPDMKTRVARAVRQCGGLGATALVTAARLGARCAYGAILGQDALSRFVEDALRQEGIDTSVVVRRADAHPGHSLIIVGQEHPTRNVFSISGVTGADADQPGGDVIRSAGVLFVDHHGTAGGLRAARIAREAGMPVVADFEREGGPEFAELLDLVDNLVLSFDFAGKLTGAGAPEQAVERLWTPRRHAVVVTAGAMGAWYKGIGCPTRHQPAFRVDAVDTTGCGDVFHGAYAAGLAGGMGLVQRVRQAAAAAAIKATSPGGQAGIPDRTLVAQFMQEQDEEK